MAKSFRILREKMSPESQARATQKAQSLMEAMSLTELRQAKGLSQVDMGDILEVHQAAVSKMEHRSDMYLSSLRNMVGAMGGELVITARFEDEDVRINQFDNSDDWQNSA
ncbi:MAG: XRE family transcriptional regulator, partial [Gammaproteobacteria bacterium]|nr:XRE family transcriptional regulator [Gammaproteobacteria bacterium]